MFSSDAPAHSILELVRYLTQQDDVDHYVYRGQTREHPGPLIPSLYRAYEKTGRTYTSRDAEFAHSLRRSGCLFVELEPFSGWFGQRLEQFPTIRSADDARIVRLAFDALQLDPQQDVAAASGSIGDLLRKHLPAENLETVEQLEDHLTAVANAHHRRYIRDVVFCLPLGKLLGGVVAQQYGFTSGYLDATTSVEVAAFFATHAPKTYRQISAATEAGILYRFPRSSVVEYSREDAMSRRASCFPSTVILEELVRPFEARDCDYSDAIKRYVNYALDALETGDPAWQHLNLPRNWLQYSRLGRQHSAVLIPDRIVQGGPEAPEPLRFDGRDWIPAELFAVEDLGSRPRVQKYYFLHSNESPVDPSLTREYLWPRDADFFLMATKSLLMPGVDLGGTFPATGYLHMHVPRRVDLVDTGYICE